MEQAEEYLDGLNTSLEKYLKTNSTNAFKKLMAKIKIGEKQNEFSFCDYYSCIEYNTADFITAVSKQINQMQKIRTKRIKVLRSFENQELAFELCCIQNQIYNAVMKKCGNKFKNGKYILVKPTGRIYAQVGELFSQSYLKILKKKKKKETSPRRDKFEDIRAYIKKIQE